MNRKISIAQIQALIIIAALGFEILIIPMIIKSIWELLFTLAVGFLLCIAAVYSDINIEKGKYLCFIYSVKNILVGILLTKILADAVKNVMLNDTVIYKIVLIIVLVAGYAAWKGIEAIARISQMLFWFIVAGIIYVYAMSVSDIEIGNLTSGINMSNAVRGCALGLIINIAEILILLKPYIKEKNRGVIKGCISGFILIFIITAIVIGKLGASGTDKVRYPLFEIMYVTDLPNVFIKRQEGIFISLWIISALVSIFIYFTTTVEYMKAMNINRRLGTLLLMAFTFVFASFYNGETRAIRTYCFLQIIAGFLTVAVIPLIYIFRRNKIE